MATGYIKLCIDAGLGEREKYIKLCIDVGLGGGERYIKLCTDDALQVAKGTSTCVLMVR